MDRFITELRRLLIFHSSWKKKSSFIKRHVLIWGTGKRSGCTNTQAVTPGGIFANHSLFLLGPPFPHLQTKILEETYSTCSPRFTVLWVCHSRCSLGMLGLPGKVSGTWGCSEGEGLLSPSPFPLRPVPSLSWVLFSPQSSRRRLEPMMRNTCLQAALVLRNATK